MKLLRKEVLATTLAAVLAGISGCQDGSGSEVFGTARDLLTANGVEVSLSFQNRWATGYCANVSLKNNLPSVVTNWSVVVTLNQAVVTTLWNGSYTTNTGKITVVPAAYNPVIAPGATTSFGFCANATGANFLPSVTSATIVRGSTGSGGAPSTGGTSSSGGSKVTGGSTGVGGSSSGCTDTPRPSESCANAKSWGFCGQSWFAGYCARTCGLCGSGTGGSTGAGGASGVCMDTPRSSESCANAKSWGFCGQSWFAGYCTRTCGLCGSGTGGSTGAGGTSGVCTDTPRPSESCTDAKSWGFCGQSWFAGYCKQTCGVCSAGTGGATGTGGSTVTGGNTSTGGITSSGGISSTGGDSATGGVTSTGGNSSTGGDHSTGGASSTVVGVDECANGTQYCGGWGGTCTDTVDGYACSCAAGFTNTGGNYPACQKQGAELDFARNGLAAPTSFSSYNFSTETPSGLGEFSGGDFYINVSSAEGKTYFFANNANQRGVATVWVPGDLEPEPASLATIAIPAAPEFTQFGREIVLGGYYVSMARDEYPNYYIIMKVVGFTDTDVLIDWLYVYRP